VKIKSTLVRRHRRCCHHHDLSCF